jgi:eukaryotic-like serine/threonine-protein kinase
VVIDGKYRVDAVIGQGGMGAVFRAWDLRLERAVAIKVVRADLLSDPDSRARFRRESQIVARLQHPAIVTVFDYGTLPDGAAYLVMEFVPGEDLRHLMKREGRLAAARMSALLLGIAAGVESAHKSGIFHRDLKPENILLPESGTGPKVLDFGVAKLTEQSMTTDGGTLTVGGTIVGTPAYMAPEQLRGDAVDGRADVFSLGVMAYEMMMARLPYGGGSFIEIGMKQAAGEQQVDTGDIAPALADVIRRAIAYEKATRPSSPVAFATEVRGAIGPQ